MQATNGASAPRSVIELPHIAFSSLAHLHPDGIEKGLTTLLEQIVTVAGADGGLILEIPKEDATAEVVSRWMRPALVERRPFDVQLCPWLMSRLLSGATVVLQQIPADVPADATDDIEHLQMRGIQSLLIVPVIASERTYAVGVLSMSGPRTWAVDVPPIFRFTTEILATALNNRHVHEELQRARADLARMTQRFESQTRVFQDEMLTVHDFDDLVGSSPPFQAALNALREVAPTDTTTLLLGETGTGKELFARALHERSPRRQRPFVCVNCAALPATLIESELFGHERGAFTGAITGRQGRFELADRGTIFLDEIGDLPLELQPKLLRVLQEREFERVGSSTRRKVDVRVIAATHHDLRAAVNAGKFRADLFYRLSVYPVTLPPLRERREDIPELVWFLINQRQRRLHRRITDIPKATMEALQQYYWPGNVRELENVIERAMIRSSEGLLHIDENLIPNAPSVTVSDGDATLQALERTHIENMLRQCRGRINGPGNAAERLGLHPNTLRFRMKKLGVVRKIGAVAPPATT